MSLPETVEVHKLTVREFHALEAFLSPDRRHELLDGQIYVMSPPGNPHSSVLDELDDQFRMQRRPGLCVSSGGLRLSETTEFWPDLCLLETRRQGGGNPAARTARLVVEVSDSTLDYDTGDKRRAYQAAGVPEYWVVDVQGRRVLRHLAPDYAPEAFEPPGALSP
ncbi:MAG: Uma2 family endonuclease [Verrucomicrobia bacterium]|nr:Uma2 family endonuclease [Verrucomicrobiota bacterium]